MNNTRCKECTVHVGKNVAYAPCNVETCLCPCHDIAQAQKEYKEGNYKTLDEVTGDFKTSGTVQLKTIKEITNDFVEWAEQFKGGLETSSETWETKVGEKPEPKDWDREFFDKFGADKIWIEPSRDNVETILAMHSFITSLLTQQKESLEEFYGAIERRKENNLK